MGRSYMLNGRLYSDELWHYGILGQKWGVRRYQNPDGTLTEAGRKRYGMSAKVAQYDLNSLDKKRAHLVGEMTRADKEHRKAYNRMHKYLEKKGYEFEEDDNGNLRSHRDPAQKDRMYDWLNARQLKRYSDREKAINSLNSIEEQTAKLIDNIKGLGYDVTSRSMLRSSVQSGEYFTNYLIAKEMGVPMKYVLPIAFSTEYGSRFMSPVKGTKYTVSRG